MVKGFSTLLAFRTLVLMKPFIVAKWVIYPASRLIINVDASLQTASFQPSRELLRKKISGSIDGEAIQNDITGANGTPPISRELITGITPHEQKGLKAPTMVASSTERSGFLPNALDIYLDVPEIFTSTASGIVTSRYGQM